jgi:hypothetical protein
MLAILEENAKPNERTKIDKEEMNANMDANRKDTLATKQEMRGDREQWKPEMEEILEKMEERMAAIQAKEKRSLRGLLRIGKYSSK